MEGSPGNLFPGYKEAKSTCVDSMQNCIRVVSAFCPIQGVLASQRGIHSCGKRTDVTSC